MSSGLTVMGLPIQSDQHKEESIEMTPSEIKEKGKSHLYGN